MSRKFADDVELPNRDPASGNYAARKTYVDTLSSDAGNLTVGTMAKQRLPAVLNVVRTIAQVGGFIDIDASVQGNTIKTTLASVDVTLNIPTLGTEDQVIQGIVYASTAQRVLTFHASFDRLTGITATQTIPTGKVLRYALRQINITGSAKWCVESVGITQ